MRDLRPYLVVPEELISFGTWIRPDRDDAPLPGYLEGWDPQTSITIQREIGCDMAGALAASQLPPGTQLVLTVSWRNRQSQMVERVYLADLRDEQVIRVTLPGERLGGSIAITTSVCVAHSDKERPLGSARWGGSVLAQDEQILVLEGEGAMLPIADVDFAGTPFGPDASWALQVSGELGSPVLGALLLLVNTRDAELARALTAPEPDARQSALLEQLEADVAVHLMQLAEDRHEELALDEWPEQSVGEMLQGYAEMAVKAKVPSAGGDVAVRRAMLESAARRAGFGRRWE